jgi:hypothetical protein
LNGRDGKQKCSIVLLSSFRMGRSGELSERMCHVWIVVVQSSRLLDDTTYVAMEIYKK